MNLDDTQQRLRWGSVALLAAVAVLFMVLDATGNLDNAFTFIRDPMSAVLNWTAARTDRFADLLAGPTDLVAARQQIAELETQLDAAQRQIEQLQEVQGEFQSLQDLFNRARETPQFTRQIASVIAYNSSPYFQSLVIDVGTDDGVFVGMPVEGARGLVGQVYRTTPRSAQVLLVTDNISSIPARLGSSRATGLLRGGGLGGLMTLNWIDLEAPVRVGELVLTSGLGGRFPQDLIIGRVTEVERRESDLHQRAFVRSDTDFASLEAVFVITDFRAVDSTVFDSPPGQ